MKNQEHVEERQEAAERNLQRLLDWVGRADSKVSVILGVDTAMLGVVATLAPPFRYWTFEMVFSASASLLCLGLVFVFVYAGSYPQTESPRNSLVFFGTIAELDRKAFRDRFVGTSPDDYLNDLLDQCHRNAEIITKKFRYLRFAYIVLLGGLIPWVATIYLFKTR